MLNAFSVEVTPGERKLDGLQNGPDEGQRSYSALEKVVDIVGREIGGAPSTEYSNCATDILNKIIGMAYEFKLTGIREKALGYMEYRDYKAGR